MERNAEIEGAILLRNRLWTRVPPNQPPIPELASVWEWRDNGFPVFPDPHHDQRRHVPTTFVISEIAFTKLGQEFERAMQGDENKIFIDCRLNEGRTDTAVRSLLGQILKADLKKIEIEKCRNGFMLKKMDYALIKYDITFPENALTTSYIRPPSQHSIHTSIEGLITEINQTARYGHLGPGSYKCRHHTCTVSGPCMSAKSQIRWGPGDKIFGPHTRVKCNIENSVYLLHCEKCVENGHWTTYVGETDQQERNLHQRLGSHISHFASKILYEKYDISDDNFMATVLDRYINGAPDPDELLRDPYIHFNYIHSVQDRRYTILGYGYESTTERKFEELLYMKHFGNFEYFPTTFSGSLNGPSV